MPHLLIRHLEQFGPLSEEEKHAIGTTHSGRATSPYMKHYL
jgi:hypothetical protein